MRLIHTIAVIIAFNFIASESDALPITPASKSCTIVYALNGLSYASFAQQIDALRPHIMNKRVALIDLNQWQTALPHIVLSGREKSMLRKHLQISRSQNTLVLFNKKGAVIRRYESGIDLVEALMTCETR